MKCPKDTTNTYGDSDKCPEDTAKSSEDTSTTNKDVLTVNDEFSINNEEVSRSNRVSKVSVRDNAINNDNATTITEDTTTGNEDCTTDNDAMPSAPKRPRLVDFKENIKERIGFAVHLRLRDQRWEVKDSALELVTRLVKSRTGNFLLP